MNISNLLSLNAYNNMQRNGLQLMTSLQRLSSGYRINSAADDAAGLAVSEKMRAYITAVDRSILNAQDGESLVQTADGALNEVHTMLNRLTELAGQAANGVLSSEQRAGIQREADDILKEIDRVSQATNFNGIKLLDGTLSGSGSGQVLVNGLAVEQTPATAGLYEYSAMPNAAGLAAGETASFKMDFNNGSSQSLRFTMNADLSSMTAADGTVYALGGTNGDVAGSEFASAIADQLQKTAVDGNFTISDTGGALTMTNVAAGTRAPQIANFSMQVNGGASQQINAAITAPADARADIAKESFTLFDGTNQAAATFTVNGEKFALVSEGNYASAAASLTGKNVNLIRVSANSAAGMTADDLAGVTANINAKTGLALQADGDVGIQVKAKPSGEGLRLQIGPGAERYNSVYVSVGDMSSRGLGLSGLDFSSQDGAAASLARIEAARGVVSETRGDLGVTENRLGYAIRSLGVASESATEAESRIRDVDMAKEMMRFMRRQIMQQAAQAMLGQANAQASQVLQLLR